MKINPAVETHNPHPEGLGDFLNPSQRVVDVLPRRLSRMIFDRIFLEIM